MDRRTFIGGLAGGLVTVTVAARAQQYERMRRVGILMPVAETDREGQVRVVALQEELRKLGWEIDRNLVIVVRWAAGDGKLMRAYAAELVALKPDLILLQSNEALARVHEETATIPIVVALFSDPVGSGFVQSLARPGGNITGFANLEPAMGGKWLQQLKEIAPRVRRAAIVLNPEISANVAFLRAAEAASNTIGITATAAPVRDANDLQRAVAAFAAEPDGGMIVLPNPLAQVQRELIVGLAARHGLPAIYPYRLMATSGGLLSYGVDVVGVFRRAALYVDRILKGEKPADLPVQQPTMFELVINLKTAKALGITVPQSLLLRADEVIQ